MQPGTDSNAVSLRDRLNVCLPFPIDPFDELQF
jgi:hypothetical protein